jgi:hypothetical protein
MLIQPIFKNHKHLKICTLQYFIKKYSECSKIKINHILAIELCVKLKPSYAAKTKRT